MMQTTFLANMPNLPIPSVSDAKLNADLGGTEEADAFLGVLDQAERESPADFLTFIESQPLGPFSSQNDGQPMAAPWPDGSVMTAMTIAEGVEVFDTQRHTAIKADLSLDLLIVGEPPGTLEVDRGETDESRTGGDTILVNDHLISPLSGSLMRNIAPPNLPNNSIAPNVAAGAPLANQAASQNIDLIRSPFEAAAATLEQVATGSEGLLVDTGFAANTQQLLLNPDRHGRAGTAPISPMSEQAAGSQNQKGRESDLVIAATANLDQIAVSPSADGARQENGDFSTNAKPTSPVPALPTGATARTPRSITAIPDFPDTVPAPTAGRTTPDNATWPEISVSHTTLPNTGAIPIVPPHLANSDLSGLAVAKAPKHIPKLASLNLPETESTVQVQAFDLPPQGQDSPQPKYAAARETAFHLRAAVQSNSNWQVGSGLVPPEIDLPPTSDPQDFTLSAGNPQNHELLETVSPPDDLTRSGAAVLGNQSGTIFASEGPTDQLMDSDAVLRGGTSTEIEHNPPIALHFANTDEATNKTALPAQLQLLASKPIDAPSPIQQTAAILANQNSNQPGTIELMLTPETLGRIHFDMRPQGDAMAITLSAERPETLDMMRRHLPELLAELKQAGVQAGTLSFGAWSEGRHPSPPPDAATDTQKIDVVPIHTESVSIRPSIATAGGLDLRF